MIISFFIVIIYLLLIYRYLLKRYQHPCILVHQFLKVDVAVLKSRERKAKKTKKKHENSSLTILYINVELISLEPKWSLWILMWVR